MDENKKNFNFIRPRTISYTKDNASACHDPHQFVRKYLISYFIRDFSALVVDLKLKSIFSFKYHRFACRLTRIKRIADNMSSIKPFSYPFLVSLFVIQSHQKLSYEWRYFCMNSAVTRPFHVHTGDGDPSLTFISARVHNAVVYCCFKSIIVNCDILLAFIYFGTY